MLPCPLQSRQHESKASIWSNQYNLCRWNMLKPSALQLLDLLVCGLPCSSRRCFALWWPWGTTCEFDFCIFCTLSTARERATKPLDGQTKWNAIIVAGRIEDSGFTSVWKGHYVRCLWMLMELMELFQLFPPFISLKITQPSWPSSTLKSW